ncbi:TetR/AcrR family transcriptional regulator [Paenibacillus hexagrammi]|uniref:TetR/AcrR family transcriptional regulator n=1 Tax=Paenibacillus hexagrammi TaxID=2908839 RepID=A0ABY3SK13_9BACL|nr:TetR/AcrR family transcriptional regulator [Paenibacillus sp. YPD9-1]UJF34187.1 TetR/AcrR family transcriptional regulator [Paenibacillus sp. YPD9-1]
MSSEDTEQKKQYHHGDLRRTLIRAGYELIVEGGASSLDLRKVARKAGVSHTAPYRHFADKKALLAAIAEEGYRGMSRRIRERLEPMPDHFMDKLHAFATEYVDFAMNHPQLMREMFSGLTIEIREYPTLYESILELFGPLVDMIEQGQETEEVVQTETLPLALVIWSMMHGVSTLLIENMLQRSIKGPNEAEKMIHLCVNTLYHGILPRKPS